MWLNIEPTEQEKDLAGNYVLSYKSVAWFMHDIDAIFVEL